MPYQSITAIDTNTDLKYDAKELGFDQPARWLSVDPMADKYPGWSPYNYSLNSSMLFIDRDGRDASSFVDENGNEKIINDGSNARYIEQGDGTSRHYEFSGFDPGLEGNANINLTTLVQESQNLNDSNPSLMPDGNTYCNFATQNIMRTLESTPVFEGALITGKANDMRSSLESSSAYQQTDYATARSNAQNGGLSIYSSLGKVHGHVGTFSVGENIVKGETANIGANNRFMNLYKPNGVYNKSAQVSYFILRRPYGY